MGVRTTPNVTIVGAGVMGTALAVHLAGRASRPCNVRLCGTAWDDEIIRQLSAARTCPRLEVALPERLELFSYAERQRAAAEADVLILAVSSGGLAATTAEFCLHAPAHAVFASITKGIEESSLMTMVELMEHTLRQHGRRADTVVKLAGPLRAVELARGFPAEAVFASRSREAAEWLRSCFVSPAFRCQVTHDVIGVDLCASLKNAYAILFGLADALYPGADNPKAALFGRIAAELGAFVTACGGDLATVSGIAGVGDLYVTVQGGRNRSLGYRLGQGASLAEAQQAMHGQTIEGLAAADVAWQLAKKLEQADKLAVEQDLPLLCRLRQVLTGEATARQAMATYWGMGL